MRIRSALVTMAVTGAGLVGLATPANAATNTCDPSHFCLFYNSNIQNAYYPFWDNVSDFAGYTYKGAGAGAGQQVKNNAASAQNLQTNLVARVYYNSNYGGVYDNVQPTSWRNLSNTYNENASFKWFWA
ncbi:peptidase inhibitor family I36 protein [Streptomyces barkulensis]|uniref:peptidase inhibitor family I36 protein n=1 Tax=Streptomyces barkulensis TaxID=1257026 RepID=UPI00130448F1|nr:peptidase inhibitor family I36 protein [Streptomyces barkulensis]